MPSAAISAIESAGKLGEVTVVTVDGSRGRRRGHQGRQAAHHLGAVPAEIGRIAAEKAYDHLAGKPVAKDIKVPVELITRENAASSEA